MEFNAVVSEVRGADRRFLKKNLVEDGKITVSASIEGQSSIFNRLEFDLPISEAPFYYPGVGLKISVELTDK